MATDKQQVDASRVEVLPPTVKGMLDCARYEIQRLETETESLPPDAWHGDHPHIRDLEDALDDGFMCVDVNVLKTKLQAWYQLFPNVTPYFAIKCNPDPMVVHWLACHCGDENLVAGFDCASLNELEMATSNLVHYRNPPCTPDIPTKESPPLAVYANPQRAEKDLLGSIHLFPLDHPMWLTVDALEELAKIHQACQETGKPLSTMQLILRILVPDGNSTVPLGEKFGCTLDNIEALERSAVSWGFTTIGISFHCGSGGHDPSNYQQALQLAEQALRIINEIQQEAVPTAKDCWLVDIGGGFPGWDGRGGDDSRFCGMETTVDPNTWVRPKEVPLTAAEIAMAIQPKLEEFRKGGCTVISEPGRYFVEASAFLVSRVYKVWKETTAEGEEIQCLKIPHGVHGVFKDVLLCNEEFIPHPLPQDDTSTSMSTLLPSRIVGPSGDVRDVVNARCQLPLLQVGDSLVFDRMGAYTLSIASRAGRPIVRYVQGS